MLTLIFSKQSVKRIISFSEYQKRYRNGTSETIIVGKGMHGESFELRFANAEDEKEIFKKLQNASKTNYEICIDCDCTFTCK